MSYENDNMHIFLEQDAPFDFIVKTLKQILPENIKVTLFDKNSHDYSFNSIQPDITLSYSSQMRNTFYRVCHLAAEALSLHYGKKLDTEKQSFFFYDNSEFITFLYDDDSHIHSDSTILIFTEDKPRFLTKEEQCYYFDDDNEERIEELNKKYEWHVIDLKVAFTSYHVDHVDKGKTKKDFEEYIAPLIPLFEKHSIQQNININFSKNKHTIERI